MVVARGGANPPVLPPLVSSSAWLAELQRRAPALASPDLLRRVGGTLAAMFHKETVSDALQGCAMLIAGWNQGRVDDAGLTRTTKALRALGLPDLAARVEKLRQIADA